MLRVNNLMGFNARRLVAGGGGGPTFANVKLLVAFDGADGATSATDESPVGRTLTFAGNAQIDTAQSKFGGASLLLDGNGDRVSAPDSTYWELTGEFTIELWARFSSLPSTSTIMAHAVDSLTYGWFLLQNNAGGVGFRFERISGGSITHSIVSAGSVVTTGTWYHIAVDRDAADNLRLYVDGTMVASKTGASGARLMRACDDVGNGRPCGRGAHHEGRSDLRVRQRLHGPDRGLPALMTDWLVTVAALAFVAAMALGMV